MKLQTRARTRYTHLSVVIVMFLQVFLLYPLTSYADTNDTTEPFVTAVSVPADGQYAAGEQLVFTVKMSENVTVTGTPSIALVIGTTIVQAVYSSGSGSDALTFRYTVQAGQMDKNGITVGALSLNGGTVQDMAGNNAILTLNSIASTANVMVDTTVPAISSVTLEGAAQSTYGEPLTFTAFVADDTENAYNVPTGTVSFYEGDTLLGTQALMENIPVISQTPSSSAPHIDEAKLTCSDQCPTIDWGGLKYWAYSYTENTDYTMLVAVDAHNNIVKIWNNVMNVPIRYVNKIELDTANRTVTLTGQGNAQLTLPWAFLSHANAQASITLSNLSKGDHKIKAVYAGNGTHSSGTSTEMTHTVMGLNSVTTLSSDSASAEYGGEVTFTASVAGMVAGQPKPTGTVTFKNGNDILGSVTLDGSGVAKLTKSDLPIGTLLITAIYNGDVSIYNASQSSNLSQYVIAIKTKAALTASPASPKYGDKLTLHAQVTNQSENPLLPNGGKAVFMEGSATLGEATVTNGVASFEISTLSVGQHTLRVVYNAAPGDLLHGSSTSVDYEVTVGKADTHAAVSSDALTVEYGEKVTLTAQVSADTATGQLQPTGTVTFKDGADVLGTVALDGDGIAKLVKSDLPVDGHLITAVYNGDGNYWTSQSSSLSQDILAIKTKSALTSSSASPKYGDKLTLHAQVTNQSENPLLPNGGKAVFMEGSATLGEATVTNGVASFEISTLSVGQHTLHVVYNAAPGDVLHGSSTSVDYEVTVGKADTQAAVSSDALTVEYGEKVTLTARVSADTATGQLQPTGTVTFKDGADVLGTVALDGDGIAKLVKSDLPVDGHLITAVYNGDDNYSTSQSSSLSQDILAIKTKAALTASPASPKYGDKLTLHAQVTNQSENPLLPNGGKAVFMEGSTTLGEATVTNGVASFEISTLSVGQHTLRVVYNAAPGDVLHGSSTSVDYEVTVGKADTHAAVSSDALTVEYGEKVTLTARVSADTATGQLQPTGTVTFKDGADVIGTVALDGDGIAKLVKSDLPIDGHLITVVYNGDGNYWTSQSSSLSQAILAIKTKAALTASPASPKYGDKLTLHAQVTNQSENPLLPNGGKAVFMEGSTTLGEATVTNGVASFEISTLSVGQHTLHVVYNAAPGDVLHGSSTSVDYEVTVFSADIPSNVTPPITSSNMVDSNGKVNADLLNAAMKADLNVLIHTTTEAVYLPASALGYDRGLTLYNDSGASITIPLSTLKLDDLAQLLGVEVKDLVIRVEMTKLTGDAATAILNAANAMGATPIADAFDFRVVAVGGGKETAIPNFGQLISRTISLPAEITGMATAVLFDPDTKIMSFVPSTFETADHQTTVTIKRNGMSIYTVIQTQPASFDDMVLHWAKNEVATLSSKLIVEGTENNLFEPNRNITRAEFAALIVRSLGIQPITSPTHPFNDVLSSRWYAGTIAAVTEAGLMQGDEKGNFNPDTPITRKEMVAIVVRAMTYAGKSIRLTTDAEADTELTGFADSADLGWARTEFASAVKAGLIEGKSATQLAANANANRAEAAALIARYLKQASLIN